MIVIGEPPPRVACERGGVAANIFLGWVGCYGIRILLKLRRLKTKNVLSFYAAAENNLFIFIIESANPA